LALLLAGPALAGDQPAGPDLGKAIAPLVDGQTVAVFHVNLDKVTSEKVIKLVTQLGNLKPSEAAPFDESVKLALGVLKDAGVHEVYGVTDLVGLPFEPVYLAVPVANEQAGKKIRTSLEKSFIGLFLKDKIHLIPGFVVFAPKHQAERLAKFKSEPLSQLTKALAAHSQADIQLAVVLPEPLRKSVGELIPMLPKEVGGGKTAPFLKGFQYFAAGITLTPKVTVDATVQASDAKAAAALRGALLDGMKHLKSHAAKEFPDPELLTFMDKANELLTPKLDKDRLTWNLTEKEIIPIVQPLLAKIRAAAEHAQSLNNLKQIGLAIHSYHDAYKHFPTNVYDKNGKALLSWRVQILSFVEHANLYQQFKMDEPWDSEHNKKLAKDMPEVFRSPNSKAAPGKTIYLGPAGPGLFFSGPKELKFGDITDGTSNTIMVLGVDDDHAVDWTKPADLPINPKQPLKGLGGNPQGTFQALFADGSAHILNRKIAPQDFYHMLTIAGGEVVPNVP
jgi:hypothetical protein